MQHTEKYRFDLIEKEDVFSPDALNDNMEKVEEAITDAIAHADAADAALDQRVQMLELHKFVVGFSSTVGFVDLGRTPLAVIASNPNAHAFVTQGHGINGNLYIQEGGFYHTGNFPSCRYVAFF